MSPFRYDVIIIFDIHIDDTWQANYYRSSGSVSDDGDIGGDDEDNADGCAMEDAPEDWGPPKDLPQVYM